MSAWSFWSDFGGSGEDTSEDAACLILRSIEDPEAAASELHLDADEATDVVTWGGCSTAEDHQDQMEKILKRKLTFFLLTRCRFLVTSLFGEIWKSRDPFFKLMFTLSLQDHWFVVRWSDLQDKDQDEVEEEQVKDQEED